MGPALIALLATSQKPAPVSIQLSAPKAAYKSGDEVIFAAKVKNLTKQPLEMVTEQDSMNFGLKAPLCVLESKQPNGKWQELLMKDVGRCGNSNPLKVSDFVTILPGKQNDILNGMEWTKYEVKECLKTPGTYRVRLRYDSTPQFRAWLGGPLMPGEAEKRIVALQEHYDRTPKGIFISNEVTIRIQ